ncbi:McrBC 5-methylcytosine restriction system component [Streptomyces virens]|uniref:McrBC 5-methylcytosine restriction system component n=1 Tax=Streptomyces virens TaxID=285572 RepID=A0ABP6P9F2_9ACTN|nr:restriction endonuclease [Streptomyces calvus]MBA8978649.1 5-methylcytosine-specific restriction enzyme subunit McrC [Streptomyces calvus]
MTDADAVVVLREHGPWTNALMDPAVGRTLATTDWVDARPDPYAPGDPRRWQVRAKSRVGAVRVGDLQLTIVPKLPVRRLFFLLGYALDPRSHWGHGDGNVLVGDHDDLLPAVAHAFERQAEHALRRGLLQGYRHTDEALPVVRGRIRESDQIRRRYGFPVPVEISFDEFTVDIPENRLLLAAVERLVRLQGVPRDVRGRLLRLRVRLEGVSLLRRGAPLPSWTPSRLNSRYCPALRLAELILHEASIEQRGTDTAVSGFLLDLAKVFEDFVSVALRQALRPYGGRCQFQTHHHLDEAEAVLLKPDLVWYDDAGRPIGVADAKYKAEKDKEGFPSSDLYQMLAYCTSLGLPSGHLVYAKGRLPRGSHQVRHAGVVITQHALELDRDPVDLLAGMEELAEFMVRSQ